MSRSRIIGGNFEEIVAGEYKMYSEADIINQSNGKVTQTGHSGGVKLGPPSRRSFGFIIPKCLVTFRPGKDYETNPEYGFDWVRKGDTTQLGENPFIDVMGYRYKEVFHFIKVRDNEGIFEPVSALYEKKLNSFNSYFTYWENKSNPPLPDKASPDSVNTVYSVPRLTILKGKKASLRVIMEIVESPSKITLEFENPKASKYLKLSTNQLSDIKTGVYDNSDELEIECIKKFSDTQNLRVLADGMVCGSIKILPNNRKRLRKVDVLFINVRTGLNATTEYVQGPNITYTIGEKTGVPAKGATEKFEKTLNQALVVPKIKTGITIDCTTQDFNQFSSNILGTNQIDISDDGAFRKYLNEKLEAQYGKNISEDTIRIFFIGDNYPGKVEKGKIKSWTNGFAFLNSNFGVMFGTHDKGTVAHEMMHALGLPHTFDSTGKSAQFTYEIFKTNNIMDYKKGGLNDRICVFGWQWKILNKNILI